MLHLFSSIYYSTLVFSPTVHAVKLHPEESVRTVQKSGEFLLPMGRRHTGIPLPMDRRHTGILLPMGRRHTGIPLPMGRRHTGILLPMGRRHTGILLPTNHRHSPRYYIGQKV